MSDTQIRASKARSIHKFALYAADVVQLVFMPKGAKVLSVGGQNGCIYAWALVDSSAPLRSVRYIAVGTGWSIENAEELLTGMSFVDTVRGEPFVWHIFFDSGACGNVHA